MNDCGTIGDRTMIIRSNYCHMVPELKRESMMVLCWLGVSSISWIMQETWFTCHRRMCLWICVWISSRPKAEDIIEILIASELYRIIRDYGG